MSTKSTKSTTPEPILIAWSGGKDSALALQTVLDDPQFDIQALVTTVTTEYNRINIHGVRVELLEKQAQSIGIPLEQVDIPPKCPNTLYEERMAATLTKYRDRGVRRSVFGDLFLEDIREYRDQTLAQLEMEAIYPLWKLDTAALAKKFVADGFQAHLVCVDPAQLDPSFCGRPFDESLLADLPENVDPCGENGEFHTFVHQAPYFKTPIPIKPGKVVERENFYYADLLPA